MKNKNKILSLFLVIVVCSSLIFSLCSFTTINDREYDVYEPLGYTVDVHYVYHRVTTTLDEYYYGVIPSFNRTLYSSSGGNSPKAFASNYLMSGTASLDYSTPKFTFTDTEIANSYYTLSSDSPTTTSLLGVIELNGLFNVSDVNDYLELTDTQDAYYNFASPDYFSLSGSGYYIDEENNVISFTDVLCDNKKVTAFNVSGNDYMASINSVIVNWYNSNEQFESGLENIYFTNFTMQFSMIKDFKSIKYRSNLYSSSRRSSHFSNLINTLGLSMGYSSGFDDGYVKGMDEGYNVGSTNGYSSGFDDGFVEGSAEGYNEGRNDGYTIGFSDGSVSWGSFTNFLKDTVAGFLDFEFVPNISLGNILSVILGLLLVFTFLRIFAGG